MTTDEALGKLGDKLTRELTLALGAYRQRREDLARWRKMDVGGRYVAEYVASPEPRRRIASAARTLRGFSGRARKLGADPSAILRVLARGA